MEEVYDSVTAAVLAAVNDFPGLPEGTRFAFGTLGEESGLALIPGEGAVIEEESRSVTGRRRRMCRLPFVLACRVGGAGEKRREQLAAWLDGLGRWLEGQAAYPALDGGRRLADIRRVGAPRPEQRAGDRTEAWVMEMAARYEAILF